ncbi:MAG: hypothetical protein J6S71_03045 [Clostridia bacterium]|nr:hypothetical protein [Clostridia bacterium]
MKFSEMSTDQAADFLCEITPMVASIATDEELLGELRKAIDPKKAANRAEMLALGAEKITKIIPILLKKRKADIFGILGALNGVDADTIARQNIFTTMKQLKEIVKDKELLDFFKSCADSEGSE